MSVPCVLQGGPCDVSGGGGGGGVDVPLVLYSCPVGPTCVARSRHQLVGFTWQADTFDSVWQVGLNFTFGRCRQAEQHTV